MSFAAEQGASTVYAELKRLAGARLRGERPDHTLSATELVHEAYLKLAHGTAAYNDRAHFMRIAARAMRQVLVDHALARKTEKRGGDWQRLTLTNALAEIEAGSHTETIDVLGLDETLTALEALDPRQANIVELRYFAGLSIEETAGVMNISPATVKREWAVARMFLRRGLEQ